MPTCAIPTALRLRWPPYQNLLNRKRNDNAMTRDIKDLIVALDIGTSKVVAVVAEILPEGRFEVLGLGQHESSGMRKGVVVNIEATVRLARELKVPVFASGGVAGIEDVDRLCAVEQEGV